jgi:FkbM family methyltransferase
MVVRANVANSSQKSPRPAKFLLTRRLSGRIAKMLFPDLYWVLKFRRLKHSTSEYEMRIAPFLCDPHKISIDVGAGDAPYSVIICERSARVIAFEARVDQAAEIRQMARAKNLPIEVESIALSDRAGVACLRILTKDLGRSTIERSNDLYDADGSSRVERRVPMLPLDDYELRDVGFIKIDVEGHELAVLRGAEKTIRASMPNLLIEIEDRHRPNALQDVPEFLANFGYEGYFILDGQLKPLATFDPNTYQNPNNIGGWKDGWVRKGIYVNNFIFIPAKWARTLYVAADCVAGAGSSS